MRVTNRGSIEMKWVWGIGLFAITLLLISIETQVYYDRHPVSAQERKAKIKAACDDQYPGDELGSLTCQNTIILNALVSDSSGRIESAKRNAGE
jgi:hypothetical protein